jgi:hypothetical protein
MPIGILNLGGARGEESFFAGTDSANAGELGIRCDMSGHIGRHTCSLVGPRQHNNIRDLTSNAAPPIAGSELD